MGDARCLGRAAAARRQRSRTLPALLGSDCALLFANFLGQVTFLVPDEAWSDFAAAWRRNVWPLLDEIPWASFHDRVSGEIAPRSSHRDDRGVQLGEDEIVALYGPDQAGELLDHRATELLPRGEAYAYFDWPIVPGRHHLIEGVRGRARLTTPGARS